MAFEGAITGANLIRSTWTDATVLSASEEAAAYPKENIIDGNRESEWRAINNGQHSIIIDSANASLDMDYLCLWFGINNLPTQVSILTSSDNIVYAEIANNYDGDISTTLSASLDGTSRIVPVVSTSDILVGNTIRINNGSYDERYIVVGIGATYVEVDRLPKPFDSGDTLQIAPAPVFIAAIGGGESLRYIKISITGTPAHLLEVQAFKMQYVFDNDILPLNAFPIQRQVNVGNTISSFSGYHIGRMQTAPFRSQFTIGMARIFRDAIAVFEWILRQDRIGILLDDGTWWEVVPAGTINIGRRPSTDAELVSYATSIIYQEV